MEVAHMKFKKALLLIAMTALLTSCGCSNSARRSSNQPEPISTTSDNPVTPSEESRVPDSKDSRSSAPVEDYFTITWLDYYGEVFKTERVPRGVTPELSSMSMPKIATDACVLVFSHWDPSPVPAYADATYSAIYTNIDWPYWPAAEINDVMRGWGVAEDSVVPFRDLSIISYTFTNIGNTIIIAFNGLSSLDASQRFQKYISEKLTSYTAIPDPILGEPTIVYLDPTAKFYISLATEQDGKSSMAINKYNGDIPPVETFTVTWKNYNGNILEIDYNVPKGSMPSYDYETPTRPSNGNTHYTFTGWTPTPAPVTADITYTATFSESTTPITTYTITWKNYDNSVLKTSTVNEGEVPVYTGATPTRPSSGGKTYTFAGWSPTPVAAYSNATYTATFNESGGVDPQPAEWPTAFVNQAITYWGAPSNAFPPFLDSRITNYDAQLNGSQDTLRINCEGLTFSEGKTVYATYVSTYLGSFTPNTTLLTGQTAYIDPSNSFYIAYNPNYVSCFQIMAVKYSAPVQTTYTVTWENYDGTTLEIDENVPYGATPSYDGSIPSRPSTTDYVYYFNGWNKPLAPVTGNVTYVATYYESIFNMTKSSGTWKVQGLRNPNRAGQVSIPSTFYDGAAVTGIIDQAFKNCANVTKMIVPNSITEVGESAFANMTSLQELEVPYLGKSIDATGANSVLGYYFGSEAISGATATKQYYSGSGSITRYIPNSLNKVTINGGVINRGAFEECFNLPTVILNEGVTEIERQGFYNSGITAMNVPSTVTRINDEAFSRCQNLTTFYASDDKAGERITELGFNIFQNCSSLQDLSIPIYQHLGTLFGQTEFDGTTAVTSNGVTYYIPSSLQSVTATGGSLIRGAFENMWLTTIGITEDVVYITPGALAGTADLVDLSIPYVGVTPEATEINVNTQFGAIFGTTNWASGKTYAAAAFTGISGSSNITYYLPKTLKNVTVTGNYPVFRAGFDHCEYIETITFTEGLSVVPEYFFRECKAATAIDIGTNVTDINNYAFEHCEALLEAPLYEGLEHLGRFAFGYCNALTSITIPSTITEFSRSGEGGGYQFFKCASLTTVTMLCSITDTYMFKMCPVLTTVTMSPNIAVYKQNMFEQSGLTTFTVPEGVTNLDAYVFEQCESLTTVNLPVSLVKIGGSCFSGCTALATINYAGTTAQWASVTKNTSWAKNVITTFVTCSDGIAYI